jgi:hypothetical protein
MNDTMPEGIKDRVAANESTEVAGGIASSLVEMLTHIDGENSSRANVLIGICSVLLTLVLPKLQDAGIFLLDWDHAGWLIIATGALVSVINAVFAFKPSVYSPKRHLSLFYPGSYLRRLTKEQYSEHLVQMFQHDRNLLTELSYELYNYGGIVIAQAKRVERSIYILVGSLTAGAVLTVILPWLR